MSEKGISPILLREPWIKNRSGIHLCGSLLKCKNIGRHNICQFWKFFIHQIQCLFAFFHFQRAKTSYWIHVSSTSWLLQFFRWNLSISFARHFVLFKIFGQFMRNLLHFLLRHFSVVSMIVSFLQLLSWITLPKKF